jgi:hypothetical protein
MEVLIIQLIVGIDQRLRPRLAKIVPDPIAILINPAQYFLIHGGIRIGPRRYPSASAAGGIPLGGIIGLILGIFLADDILEVNAGRTGVVVLTSLLGATLGTILLWHFTRGGELQLIPSGVVFTCRRQDVLVPWQVFQSDMPSTIRDDGWVECPLDRHQADRIVLIKNGKVIGCGDDVQTSHVRVDRPGFFARWRGKREHTPRFVAFRDIYCVRPEEWLPFVLQIAELLLDHSVKTSPVAGRESLHPQADLAWE